MTALDEPDRVHELRVVHRGAHNYRVELDGHEILPTSLRIEFDQAAKYAIATLRLPVVVENLEAIAALDISLGNDGNALEEC